MKSAGFFFVPIDDYNTMLYQVIASDADDRTIDCEQARRQMSMLVGEDVDDNFRSWRNGTNDFGQNRELMSMGIAPPVEADVNTLRNAYTGIDAGVQIQDLAVVETMGLVSDRTKEHFGVSDAGVVHWRSRLIQAVKDFVAGESPPGLRPPASYHKIGTVAALVLKGRNWTKLLPFRTRRSSGQNQ